MLTTNEFYRFIFLNLKSFGLRSELRPNTPGIDDLHASAVSDAIRRYRLVDYIGLRFQRRSNKAERHLPYSCLPSEMLARLNAAMRTPYGGFNWAGLFHRSSKLDNRSN